MRSILAHAVLLIVCAGFLCSCSPSETPAKRAAREVRDDAVPPHLKDTSYGSREAKAQREAYKYPHNYGGWVKQQYLPDSLKDAVFYRPQGRGYEQTVAHIRAAKGMPDDTQTDPPQGIPHP